MGRIVALFLVLVLGHFFVRAQETSPAKPPQTLEQIRAQRKADEESQKLKPTSLERGERDSFGDKRNQVREKWEILSDQKYRRQINLLYRKPNKKELESLRVDPKDIETYADFLRQRNTGIFKLVSSTLCADNVHVVAASPECLKYKFPGAGASYSFRVRNYRISRLADITFNGRSLIAKGRLIGSIFGNLGDVPLESIRLDSSGLKFLLEYQPPKEAKLALKVSKLLADGLENRGFIYGRAVYANENTTFVLRSIAFRGRQLKSAVGFIYNELDFDKRRDVIVAFRIVRKSKDGSITILWKELRDRRAPKLKLDDEKMPNDLILKRHLAQGSSLY